MVTEDEPDFKAGLALFPLFAPSFVFICCTTCKNISWGWRLGTRLRLIWSQLERVTHETDKRIHEYILQDTVP